MDTLHELVYFCEEENSVGALMLTGEWGCGKTYLIENEFEQERYIKEHCIVIRISLFGEESIESINNKVRKSFLEKYFFCGKEDIDNKRRRITDKIHNIVTASKPIIENNAIGKAIMSINPIDFISITNKINGKKVILVFDDLERSCLSEVVLLGCINQYCENLKIKTIIVANEEMIVNDEKDKPQKGGEVKEEIKYNKIKEKLVCRTIKYKPDFTKIIEKIIGTYSQRVTGYTGFLVENKEQILDVFCLIKHKNIRSLKCAIQDFERLFEILKKFSITDSISMYLSSFIVFFIESRANEIEKTYRNYYQCGNDLENKYNGLYDSKFMYDSVKKWIIEGEWNTGEITNEVNQRLQMLKPVSAEKKVCNEYLLDLEERIVKQGFGKALELAYEGRLTINEYVHLLENINSARLQKYELPCQVSYSELREGLKRVVCKIENDGTTNEPYRVGLNEQEIQSLNSEEKDIYNLIENHRDESKLDYRRNRKLCIKALGSGSLSEILKYESTMYSFFDMEMAEETFKCYKNLSNRDKRRFYNHFENMWNQGYPSIGNWKNKLEGIEHLLVKLREERENNLNNQEKIKAINDKNFIDIVSMIKDKIITLMNKY